MILKHSHKAYVSLIWEEKIVTMHVGKNHSDFKYVNGVVNAWNEKVFGENGKLNLIDEHISNKTMKKVTEKKPLWHNFTRLKKLYKNKKRGQERTLEMWIRLSQPSRNDHMEDIYIKQPNLWVKDFC